MYPNFKNKVVLITGGTGGLASVLTTELQKSGAKIIALDLQTESFKNTDDVLYITTDITNQEAVEQAIMLGIKTFGKIDILINNAGITHMSKFENTSIELINSIMNVNFMGSVYVTKTCLPHLIASQGHIVAISSVAGFAPLYGRAAYSASKHAMEGFFRSLSAEVKDQHVDVTLVCPSFVNTRPELEVQVNNGVSSPGAAKKNTNGQVIPPNVAAHMILRAITKKKPTLMLGRVAIIANWLFHLFPKTYMKVMIKGAKKEF